MIELIGRIENRYRLVLGQFISYNCLEAVEFIAPVVRICNIDKDNNQNFKPQRHEKLLHVGEHIKHCEVTAFFQLLTIIGEYYEEIPTADQGRPGFFQHPLCEDTSLSPSVAH